MTAIPPLAVVVVTSMWMLGCYVQTKRHLNSVEEDCTLCTSSTVIGGNCQDAVPIGCLNTSEVTDMAFVFFYTLFDESINCWNTAHVTTMYGMFSKAYYFNQPLNDCWNVSSVMDIQYMFYHDFNQCLSSWASEVPTDVPWYCCSNQLMAKIS